MDVQVSLGHVVNMVIDFLDQNGNPMLTQVVTDSAPVWANTHPEVELVTAAGDGLKAVANPIAIGADTISTAVTVGGKTFNATLAVNVIAAPQVLTSVVITPTVI